MLFIFRSDLLKHQSFFPRSLEIHWLSIINSVILVALLMGFIVVILTRVLRNDFSRYDLRLWIVCRLMYVLILDLQPNKEYANFLYEYYKVFFSTKILCESDSFMKMKYQQICFGKYFENMQHRIT